MKLLFTFLILAMMALGAQAQPFAPPSPTEIASAPVWARMMYAPDPHVWAVDSAYRTYYNRHPFEKSFHTQYYKRWRRAAEPYIGNDGHIQWPSLSEKAAARTAHLAKLQRLGTSTRGGSWTPMGPMRVFNGNATPEADHINIYSLAQCAGTPNVMYAGTEPGEIYKSTDGGLTWACVSQNTWIDGGVRALAVSPSDPNLVLAGAGWYIERSTDGGATWSTALSATNLYPNEIRFHPTNPQIVLAATDAGLYRSTDGGANFTQQYSETAWDVQPKPGNPNTFYMIKHNPNAIRAEFFISTDAGGTWTLQANGWYSSSDPNRSAGGARLAVTPADTNRVYAYLIGESKANDYGFIGLYRSDDGGMSWSLPNGPAGGPYTTSHPNLAMGTTTWTYHQGFYNCALMASATNADSILIGGLNLWRSDDGGYTFSSVSGYIGGPLSMHVDNQDFRVFGSDYWITTDGGIYHSSDFFSTQPTVRMDGIHAGDYWGFGTGWNEDVVVGGMYHNGNNAWHENYGAGNHLALGGGEAPTGYVNPGNNRRTYFSDIGGRIIPLSIGQPVAGAPFGMAPNETYFSAESSEFEFHPNCYNVGFLGRDHRLWKTSDGGGSFTLVHAFGNDSLSQLKYIEVSRSNPEVIYLTQQPASGNSGQIWKTTDGGQSWNTIPLPSGPNRRRILLALDPEDENLLYAAFPQAGNGNKIFRTTNGGTNWTNLSTSTLDDESAHSIALIGGTDGGIYYCTEMTVYYRDNTMANWVLYNADLPIQFNSNIARPFYRDGKLRIASYGKGIWESPLHTQPSRPIATIMVDRLTATCASDSFHFEDHSMLNHTNAAWSWTFQNGSPGTSTLRNPAVAFPGMGQYTVTLAVTDGNGQTSRDTMTVEVSGIQTSSLSSDFEAAFPPTWWTTYASGNLSWTQNTSVGGYGASTSSAACDNYYNDGGGSYVDLRAYVNLDTVAPGMLTFDVAYAEYGGQYTDTLEVLVSTDCGQNFTQLYRRGGQGLATAPNYTAGPYVPTSNEWRTDTVDLSAYQGAPQVVVAFRCYGHYGQVMYLDNVNLDGTPIIGLESGTGGAYAQLAPNPALTDGSLRLVSNVDGALTVRIYTLEGKVATMANLHAGEDLNLDSKLAAGTYIWEIAGETLLQRGRLVLVHPAR